MFESIFEIDVALLQRLLFPLEVVNLGLQTFFLALDTNELFLKRVGFVFGNSLPAFLSPWIASDTQPLDGLIVL